jgi:hypothetical protein
LDRRITENQGHGRALDGDLAFNFIGAIIEKTKRFFGRRRGIKKAVRNMIVKSNEMISKSTFAVVNVRRN